MQVYGMRPNQGWVSLSSRVVVLILQSKLDLPEVVKVLTSNVSNYTKSICMVIGIILRYCLNLSFSYIIDFF